ncbi:MAG: type II toxin-antitoxin system HicB family antitoxin [Candidatus Gracilibacteria bacterium]|jgi:predicted RNase H-like HicB family nuclease
MKKIPIEYTFEVIFTEQEEGGFTAEVPDLPGCISEGDTFEEAEVNIEEAIDLYLETLEARGLPIPVRNQNKTLRMSVIVTRADSFQAVHA